MLSTSLTVALGMLPLTYGIEVGVDMLMPLAVAATGALAISAPLSLVVTPAVYYVLPSDFGGAAHPWSVPVLVLAPAVRLTDAAGFVTSRRITGQRG